MKMISVIICTYNRAKYIYNVLKSVADGALPASMYEIVVVNNNSSDNTEAECRRFRLAYPNVAMVYCEEREQGLSHARNSGIKNSSGNILVFVDDDALVNDGYLKSYFDFFDRHEAAMAAGGPIIPLYDGCKEPLWMSHYTRQLITGKLWLGSKEKEFPGDAFPGGGNAAYRRVVFEKVGLFNVELGRKGESLIGAEEKDLFDRLKTRGLKFFYLPNSILYHLIPPTKLTDEYFERLSYSIGVSERCRTLQSGKNKYLLRIMKEMVKWCGTLVLCLWFCLSGRSCKAKKLASFRYNVTNGLTRKPCQYTPL